MKKNASSDHIVVDITPQRNVSVVWNPAKEGWTEVLSNSSDSYAWDPDSELQIYAAHGKQECRMIDIASGPRKQTHPKEEDSNKRTMQRFMKMFQNKGHGEDVAKEKRAIQDLRREVSHASLPTWPNRVEGALTHHATGAIPALLAAPPDAAATVGDTGSSGYGTLAAHPLAFAVLAALSMVFFVRRRRSRKTLRAAMPSELLEGLRELEPVSGPYAPLASDANLD
jgi:hypothetical protein